MRRRRIPLTAALALGVLAATGCGGGSAEDEIRAVVGELQRTSARSSDAPRACALLTPRAQAQLTAFLSSFSGGGSCADVLGRSQENDDALTNGKVGSANVKIRGDRAVLRFSGNDGNELGLARVGGEWRVDNIVNPSLEEPVRRVDARLQRGSDEEQVLATYKAVSAAVAARDNERACALFSYGAEAQLVIARLFASFADSRAQPKRPDLSCASSLAAIQRVQGSASAFAAAAPTAQQLASAAATVEGRRATVRIQGGDAGHFVHEQGRWLVAPSPEPLSTEPAPTAAALKRCWRRAGATIARAASDLRFASPGDVRGTTVAPGRTSVKGGDWRIFYAHVAGDADPGIAAVLRRPAAVPAVAYVKDARRHAGVVAAARACGA